MRVRLHCGLLLVLLLTAKAVAQSQDFTYKPNNGTITITGYNGTNRAVSIPSQINDLPVTSIGTYAFSNDSSLTNVIIPNTVANIGDGAFDYTGLTSVTIPDSVVSLGNFAFRNCVGLTNITLGNGITNIPDFEFDDCISLPSISIPNSVARIGQHSFYGCNNLAGLSIPSSVTSIGDGAFAWCPSLTNISIPNSVVDFGADEFLACTALTNATLPNGLTNIPGTFSGCSSLRSIIVPSTVMSVETAAFTSCGSLTGVYFEGNAPVFGFDAFYLSTGVTLYYLPETAGWSTNSSGRPIQPWIPQMQVGNGTGPTNPFGFIINWASGKAVIVEATSEMAKPVWSPVTTNALSGGTFYFSDPQWTNYPSRLYRIRSP